MKTNAVIRIVLYSVVILLLTGILLTVLGVGQLRFDLGGSTGEYITGDGAVDASGIRNISIEWVSGDIQVRTAADDSQQIRFHESGNAGEDLRMVWEQKGDTLIIKYSKPRLNIGFISTPSKTLQVDLPADWNCDSFEIVTVSGKVGVQDLKAEEIELESVSAACTLECTAKEVSVTTVSGEVGFVGQVQELECESVSGECSIRLLDTSARKITMESVSADLTVLLPESLGFTAKLDSTSGDLFSDLPTDTHNGKQVYGDGSCQIHAETVSGDVNINKQ